MRAIVMRHFKTTNNQRRRIMGWADAPPIDDWQSDILAVDDYLRGANLQFDAYYSSALERARDTAAYLAHRHHRDAVHCVPALNEIHYGELQGRSKQSVKKSYPKYKTDADYVFPGGESFRQMQHRSVDFLLSLQRIHSDHTLLLVLHAGVIRGLISHFLGLDLTDNLKRSVSHRYVGTFEIRNDRCVSYDELGVLSGFVRDKIIELPWKSALGHDTGDEKGKRGKLNNSYPGYGLQTLG